jgi:hypothetical protein
MPWITGWDYGTVSVVRALGKSAKTESQHNNYKQGPVVIHLVAPFAPDSQGMLFGPT